MKQCSRCKKYKDQSSYSSNSRSKDKLKYRCKECDKELFLSWSRTKEGIIKTSYLHQVRSSKLRNHLPPTYSRAELAKWFYAQENLDSLYENWVSSGYDRWLKPSVDRVDEEKPYTLDNIQLITWKENSDKGLQLRTDGIVESNFIKSVCQYTLDNVFVKEYHSIKEASRQTGTWDSSIVACCKNKRKTTNGYKWQYSQE